VLLVLDFKATIHPPLVGVLDPTTASSPASRTAAPAAVWEGVGAARGPAAVDVGGAWLPRVRAGPRGQRRRRGP